MSETSASVKAKEMEKQGGTKEEVKEKRTGSTSDPSFNMGELRDLADMVNEYGFTDFKFENENIKVRISKSQPGMFVPQAQPIPAFAQPAAATAPAAEVAAPAAAPEEDLFQITSPIVGTFYRSSGPDKEPYVKEGSQVTPTSIVCIVEAMKLMNEIEADISGVIKAIQVENGQAVEYGQPMFVIG